MICTIDCGTTWMRHLRARLGELGCESRTVKLGELESCGFSEFSGIIISGAPTLLTEVNQKEYLAPFKFVNEVGVPILGICLGHQIIGLLHGAKISRGAKISKKEKIEFLGQDSLFEGLGGDSLFREEHSESITLPEGFKLLAKSGSCGNEAMKREGKRIYGVQFHPEMSGDSGGIVFKNFVRMCDESG